MMRPQSFEGQVLQSTSTETVQGVDIFEQLGMVLQFRRSSTQPKFKLLQRPCKYTALGLIGAGISKTTKFLTRDKLYVMKDPSVPASESPNCLACLTTHDIVICTKNGMALKNVRNKTSKNFKGLIDRVYSLDSAGKITISCDLSGVVNIHDNETLELLQVIMPTQLNQEDRNQLFKTCKFPKCSQGGTPYQALLAGSCKTIRAVDFCTLKSTDICSVAFNVNSLSIDQNLVAVAGDKKEVTLIDWRDNQQSLTFEGHKDYVNSVDLNLSDYKLVTGGEDLSARIWDLRNTAKELLLFPCKLSGANKVKFVSRDRVAIGETVDFVHMLDFELKKVDTQTVFGKLVGLDLTPANKSLVWSVETFYLPGGIVYMDLI